MQKTEFHSSWDSLVKGVTAAVFVLLISLTILFSDSGVVVKRLIGNLIIENSGEPKRWQWTWWGLRLFGSGGLYGYFGLFALKGIGRVWMHATNRHNLVIIEDVRGREYLPSPDEPDKFIQQDTVLEDWIAFANMVPNEIVSAMISKEQILQSNTVIDNIALCLKERGIDFYYRGDLDFYSGILLHDLGDYEEFQKHASFVGETLQKAGVNKIITIDPHTTYTLAKLFPKYTGYSFEVRTYIEYLSENLKRKNGELPKITFHDPCYYARFLDIYDQPREIIDALGVQCVDVRNSKKLTCCCGGPIESIAPGLSREVAMDRIQELQKTGCRIVAMCPICILNMRRVGAEVEDFSTVVAEAIQ
jgi:hypothetical protein